jgi:DegV family protein with EDD domain
MPQSKVAIVTDSTVNLPEEYLKKYSITMLPQTLIWGNETFRDTIDIQPQEFYERLGKSKISPSTSQVTPVQFIDTYKKLLGQGFQILTITVSSDLSGTMNSAYQAKESMPDAPIELFDSRSVSLAMGFCVLSAARTAAAGGSMAECKAAAQKASEHSGVLFCVDNLVFLHRGGRIGGAARFLGTALGLKPILEVRGGKVEAIERVRTQRKALERLIELVNQRINGQTGLRLGILEANAPIPAKFLLDEITSRFQPTELIQNSLTAVLGCHTGPGTVGIAYQTEI